MRATSETGASAVEYGLLISGVAALAAAAAFAFGGGVDGLFGETCDTVSASTASATDGC
ncbi:Flp family type IVb pilin [Nocardioides sp. P86]|uniref:Flp family type IVb pilin n=1 Tax=Nocardioides sp. P86 TaxID=2939569 RepID=UPI00203A4B90|nr:Flp family type IVb pilin [Nocardioides sp. P86]MCM3514093.1 Flp family type IVb pilin [Nocardioides sp. P86]